MPSYLAKLGPARLGFSRRTCAMMRFGARHFRLIKGLNSGDNGSRTLILRGTCTKNSQLSCTRSGRLRYGSGDSGVSTARSGGGTGRSVVKGPQYNFYYV